MSVIVTSCVAAFVLPWMSVTVHVTVVLPRAYGEVPLFTDVETPQLSPVVAEPRFTVEEVQRPASVTDEAAAGAVIEGASASATVTSWLA